MKEAELAAENDQTNSENKTDNSCSNKKKL